MKPTTRTKRIATILSLSAIATLDPQLSALFAQGGLTPPGAPAPTMKTLEQVEPRTPISSLPFTITNAGSYFLTTNLSGNPGGITISASGVTLDLMGFELAGGTGDGILIDAVCTNIAIRNGTVRDWTGAGIEASIASASQFQALRMASNGGDGIVAGSASTVTDCTAWFCAGAGFIAGSGGAVSGCTAQGNGNDGFRFGSGSTISGCSARSNADDGIETAPGSTVTDCVAHSNTDIGIVAGEGSTVNNCATRFNSGDGIVSGFGSTISGCAAHRNSGDGIEVSSHCTVRDNTCNFNGNGSGDGAGIHVTGGNNRIDGNNVTANDRGIDVDAEENLIIRNSASFHSGGANNYVFDGPQVHGPTNFATGEITGEHPWRNFSF